MTGFLTGVQVGGLLAALGSLFALLLCLPDAEGRPGTWTLPALLAPIVIVCGLVMLVPGVVRAVMSHAARRREFARLLDHFRRSRPAPVHWVSR